MVAPQKSYAVRVLQLKAHQHFECLHRIVATINKITHEHIVRVWHLTSLLKQLQQVVELSMNVSTNSYWGTDRLNVALFDE